jgi:ABC-type antimicrobial peptide transport system permease subunit
MNELVSHSVARQRFELFLLGLFASIALLLAAIGIYGLFAFAVSRRTHEIGLRIALGAHPRGVPALLISQATRLIVCGLVIGITASLALTRLMSGLLYGVSPADPLTLAAVSVVLASTGALASWIPARRAMSVDPMTALRCE